MYLGSWNIGDLLTFPANTHAADTGAATDADAVPAYRVYEDQAATPILTGTMATLDGANTAGFYSAQIALTAVNGFEEAKSYTTYISAAVGGVTGTLSHSFQIRAAALLADSPNHGGPAMVINGDRFLFQSTSGAAIRGIGEGASPGIQGIGGNSAGMGIAGIGGAGGEGHGMVLQGVGSGNALRLIPATGQDAVVYQVGSGGKPMADGSGNYVIVGPGGECDLIGTAEGTPTPTTIQNASIFTSSDAGSYVGANIIILSGAYIGRTVRVTAYNPAQNEVTITSLPGAMGNGDRFIYLAPR